MVYKLRKALYGLKQSPRVWFKKFSRAILTLGYERSRASHTLFVRTYHGITAIIVYVILLLPVTTQKKYLQLRDISQQ